jgi:hypothetical protein
MVKFARSKIAMCALVFAILPTSIGRADPEECAEAISKYRSALNDISDALRFYTTCLSDSRGHDDCSTEFFTLQSAQDDFESAVSSYRIECS